MPFRFTRLAIPDVVLAEPEIFEDARGHFVELYKHSDFAAFGVPQVFRQDNLVFSATGVLRGLHYQKRAHAQGKLVTVLLGRVFDVAVDIRRESPTYTRWVGVHLSDRERSMVYVPPGFAHGYCVLSDHALVLYKVTDQYAPEDERGIVWNDSEIGVQWPVESPVLSPRDAALPPLRLADKDS